MPEPIPDLNRDQTCHHYQAPTGQRCGSPALKGQYYCYHHQVKQNARNNRRVLIDPEITCMELPAIEDRATIFIALAAVVHRLAENTIDTRRAGQIVYALQVAIQTLPPMPPAPRPQARPAAADSAPNDAVQPPTNSQQPVSPSDEASATAAIQPATCDPQPATPTTIPISKESLLYFLRSRHCASCNAELFPASSLTERANPGAPPTVIPEAITQESRPALPAPQPAPHNLQLDNLQPATDNSSPGTIPTLQAVAPPVSPTTSLPSTNNQQLTTDNSLHPAIASLRTARTSHQPGACHENSSFRPPNRAVRLCLHRDRWNGVAAARGPGWAGSGCRDHHRQRPVVDAR